MKMRKLVPVSIAALAAAFLLTGCTVTGATASFAGVPDEHDVSQESEADDSGLQAFWVEDGSAVAIAISGSSTCPVVGTRINVVSPAGDGNTISIDTAPLPDRPCTMDFVPHTTVFWTPNTVTTAEPLVVQVGDRTVTLPVK